VICVIALVIFSILGIFSASYRRIAFEAFDCVLRRVTLRKCDSGLDQRLKSQITGKLLKRNQRLARTVYRHFEVFSWIFLILMMVSFAFVLDGTYKFIRYGNCNGEEGGICIFDPLSNKEMETCTDAGFERSVESVVLPDADDDPFIGPIDAKVTIIEFGCFRCENSGKALPTIKKVIKEYGDRVKLVFRDFPMEYWHEHSQAMAEAAQCAFEQGKFWEYHDVLFENQENGINNDKLKELAQELGLDSSRFNECLDEHRYEEEVYLRDVVSWRDTYCVLVCLSCIFADIVRCTCCSILDLPI